MGNARRKAADGVHLLGLSQLCFTAKQRLLDRLPFHCMPNHALQQLCAQLILDQVVGGARFHGLLVDLVVTATGEQDDGAAKSCRDRALDEDEPSFRAQAVVH